MKVNLPEVRVQVSLFFFLFKEFNFKKKHLFHVYKKKICFQSIYFDNLSSFSYDSRSNCNLMFELWIFFFLQSRNIKKER